jgi:hypothetical protein
VDKSGNIDREEFMGSVGEQRSPFTDRLFDLIGMYVCVVVLLYIVYIYLYMYIYEVFEAVLIYLYVRICIYEYMNICVYMCICVYEHICSVGEERSPFTDRLFDLIGEV